mmetsp:Transcript_33653/g.69510  ORF Transcript_33653/g.69510 Transcript_33653/m.69510 type:complete len:123 (+) Transcript_33653:18-386(+)
MNLVFRTPWETCPGRKHKLHPMAVKLLEFVGQNAHSLTVLLGSLGAATGLGYWANQNEKKVAVLAAEIRVLAAESRVLAAESRAEKADIEKRNAEKILHLGFGAEYKNYMTALGEQRKGSQG